nr:MAG TPA: actin-like protein [Caudoviricetes sp.]
MHSKTSFTICEYYLMLRKVYKFTYCERKKWWIFYIKRCTMN